MSLAILSSYVRKTAENIRESGNDLLFADAVQTVLALVLDRVAVRCTANCIWDATTSCIMQLFNQGQAIPMRWEYAEMVPGSDEGSGWSTSIDYTVKVLEENANSSVSGTIVRADAGNLQSVLPDDIASAVVTDPPYYDAVPYADLSSFFYGWLRRNLPQSTAVEFADRIFDKRRELIVDDIAGKDDAYYEIGMTKAFAEARRCVSPPGIGVVVFANKSTLGWETLLKSLVDSGWIITGSWPIDTESGNRLRAKNSAALASSVHLVCRPRENRDGSVRTDEVGDWRDLLAELPKRIHEWMPRLAEEGVVGADAIFACLGPALEIFSRYSRVEKASGETVTLKEYLEHIWAAVAKEALALVFKDADTTGFEPDARLTAMWLWTLNAGNADSATGEDTEDDDVEDDSEGTAKKAKTTGFVLEYDAARKIAQGLGAVLENLGSLVEISGETARLLPVGERANHLFGKGEGKVTQARKKKTPQLDLFKVIEQAEDGGTTFGETNVERHGETVLDRIHQSMILFAAGRSEAMKRFLVEDGAGRDPRFWRLAQALSALYPPQTEEKRWVDGVLARKKGLGF
jgi:adenine-specific DNA methylase